jgi:hypothetical protein
MREINWAREHTTLKNADKYIKLVVVVEATSNATTHSVQTPLVGVREKPMVGVQLIVCSTVAGSFQQI